MMCASNTCSRLNGAHNARRSAEKPVIPYVFDLRHLEGEGFQTPAPVKGVRSTTTSRRSCQGVSAIRARRKCSGWGWLAR
jgi:hypothetical protein